MNLTKLEYKHMAGRATPKSPVAVNCVKAFLSGGFICAAGQLSAMLLIREGFDPDTARALTTVMLIAVSAILTALDLFTRISTHTGAGTLIPITGFANAVVAPAIEFKSEGLVMGLAAKMFTLAGPVLVYGITASVIYGVILSMSKLLF